MLKWPTSTLGEICDPSRGITYGIVKVGNFTPGGVPVIRGGDIRDNRIVFDDNKRVTEEISNQFRRTILRGGEIVINLIAEPGHNAIVPPEMAGFNVSRDVAVVPLVDSVNHVYVNWYLKSPIAVEWLRARLNGSVTQKINLGVLREVPISLPPQTYQNAVGEILGALEDKIVINDRIVNASEQLRLLRLSDFLRSHDGKIRERPLSSLGQFVNGRAFTKDATGTGRIVIRIAELNSGPGASTVYNDIDVPSIHVARPGDILFAWSGSLTVARWFRPAAIINQHIFKVIPNGKIPAWLLFDLIRMKLADFKQIAADKATTMGHIQRRHLDIPVRVPADDQIAVLDAILSPLWERALLAEKESIKLVELRDTLLPKLMSGEIKVREAEKVVEEIL